MPSSQGLIGKRLVTNVLRGFFKLAIQENSTSIITILQDNHGKVFTKIEALDRICHDFYKQFYSHEDISEEALREVFEGFLVTFTTAMNNTLTHKNHT